MEHWILPANVLLHVACAALVFLLCSRGGLPKAAAALAAGLFLVNPGGYGSVTSSAVLLSTAAGLAALLTFFKTLDNIRWRWQLLLNTLVILALMSSRGAIVIPLLICLLSVLAAKTQRYESAGVPSLPLALLLLSILFWGRTTPLQADLSAGAAAQSLAAGTARILYGINHPAMMALYAVVLGSFLWHKKGRAFAVACVGLFVVAYLPYLIFLEFAGQFAYLASAALMALLGAALFELYHRSPKLGLTIVALFFAFFAIGLHETATREVQAVNPPSPASHASAKSR